MAGAPKVHDATGSSCKLCGYDFTKFDWHGRITRKEDGCIVHYKVCRTCWHDHWEAGE